MTHPDPLWTTELLALIEEASAPLRHDVRNRIASVRNLAFFVRRKLGSENSVERDPRVDEFLVKIEGEVSRTDEVIDAWLTRVQAMRSPATNALVPLRIAESVRLAVDCARLAPEVTVALDAGDDTAQVDGDLHTLALAVRCLLENSGEALGAGSVNVRIEHTDSDCRIVVADHGPGIADSARALERFETTKPGHLGLGLCMARRIVTRHGGELAIGSPERGAEVSLRIPLSGTRNQEREEQ
jgi:signal transduction histidine kinase